MISVEQLTPPVADHGEGPVWYDRWPGLRWVDMLAGAVLELDSSTGEIRRFPVGSDVAAMLRPRADDGVILAVERGFAVADKNFHTIEPLPELWSDSGVRMNEGGCDPHGRLYCGSMAYDATPGAGALYRLDLDGTARTEFAHVTISNGLTWSPDGSTAYYVDTPTHRIDALDYDPYYGFSHRRPAIHIPDHLGTPDGLTIDADGNLWIALWQGGAVHQYTPTGTLLNIIPVPAAQTTACTFGGPNLNELYITTSRNGLGESAEPAAGAVFRAHPGVRGLPVLPYRGSL